MDDYPFSDSESDVYSVLLDHPEDCPWAIRDFLIDEGFPLLPKVAADLTKLKATLGIVIEYCNAELRNNEHVFPAELLRSGKYPRIRQMRDVHQFDVGSHLAFTCSLILRRAPEIYLSARSQERLSGFLGNAGEKVGWLTLAYSAILHDFFKCFRRRRALPAKLGPAQNLVVHLPNGDLLPAEKAGSEDSIATLAIPAFVDEVDSTEVTRICDEAADFGAMCYRCLGVPADQLDRYLGDIMPSLKDDYYSLCGIYLGLADGLGKGYARYLVTKRKKRVRSLDDALTHIVRHMGRHFD